MSSAILCASCWVLIADGIGSVPDDSFQLTHSLRVTSGVAGREPCQKIVEDKGLLFVGDRGKILCAFIDASGLDHAEILNVEDCCIRLFR
jgi:hypothetical protein